MVIIVVALDTTAERPTEELLFSNVLKVLVLVEQLCGNLTSSKCPLGGLMSMLIRIRELQEEKSLVSTAVATASTVVVGGVVGARRYSRQLVDAFGSGDSNL